MSDESNAASRKEIERYVADSNLEGEPNEVLSTSGRYRLLIRTYRTAPGRWNYTRGTVSRVADGSIVCDIHRNLASFQHSFVMKDEHEYLIAGRSYMSQTIVDLDRGREFEPSGDHYNGAAFCWASCSLSPDGNTLVVDGCVWACPYEFRFFDFKDPSRGWPPLPIVGTECIEYPSDKQDPRWLDAHTIDCFQWDDDTQAQERTRLQRRGTEMVVVEHWVSESERARREAEARADAEQEAWWDHFRSTDPMYLRLVERVRSHHIPCEWGWAATGHRIVQYFRRITPPASADLHWDVDARTLTLQVYDLAGNRDREVSFEHSVAGIDACVDALATVFHRADG